MVVFSSVCQTLVLQACDLLYYSLMISVLFINYLTYLSLFNLNLFIYKLFNLLLLTIWVLKEKLFLIKRAKRVKCKATRF